ncbi:MAG: lytic transglycosylase domain-containing protein, partial [Hyphomicrobiaceae bacterium]|nr:lytic transglycosylase domain-containing protein [Hyphomicrobiaceae bacterium]
QAFMAGWLAMRFLNDRTAAKVHFEQAQKVADGPLSRGRAGYWLGRLTEAESGMSAAREHYQRAAKEIDTFYGQLSRLRIEPQNRRIDIKLPPPPTAEQIARFNGLDAVRAAQIARKSGLDPAITQAFLSHFRSNFETETEIAMAKHLAVANGDIQMALRSAKSAIARGQDMLLYSYPVHTFPSFKPLGKLPEPAVLLAITRQETEFNKNTVSVAGARGLMQVMTVTAQHVCKDYKITCELDRLLPDPAYNATIASSYIGERMADFRGSYALTMSGFNAGPGRTRQWIGQFGDPRDPKMDPVDWIERIPFQETREYVSKVLSNIQIYRARLGNEANALQLDLDLARGRGSAGAAPSEVTAPPATATSIGPDAG